MNKISIIACIMLISAHLPAQDIEGTYKNGIDSLALSGGKAAFCLSGFGALFTQMMGEGDYEYFDDFLLIHTTGYSREKTIAKEENSAKKDTIAITVYSFEGYSLEGVLAEILNPSGKTTERYVSDNSGQIIIVPKNDKKRKVRLSNLGYDGVEFECMPQKDYVVTMVKNNIIENQTVAFRIKPVDEDLMSVLLLSDNFDPGKDRAKALSRLIKQAEKRNVLDKRLRKEYIPIYGR